MALFQVQTPVLLELALERSDHEIHPHYNDDGGRRSPRGRATSRTANVPKVSRKEACLMSGDAPACGSTRCSRKGGLKGNNWERAAEVECMLASACKGSLRGSMAGSKRRA